MNAIEEENQSMTKGSVNLRKMLTVSLVLLLEGCAGVIVKIPKSTSGTAIFPEQSGAAGYLDLMSMRKMAYKRDVDDDDGYYNDTVAIAYKWSIRKSEKDSPWIPLNTARKTPMDLRCRLSPGKYALQVNADDGAYVKDVEIVIEPDEYTLVFYKTEREILKYRDVEPSKTVTELRPAGMSSYNVGGYQVTTVTTASIAVPYFVDIRSYPPISNNEESLANTLVTPDWRVRLYSVMLLGQFGTKASLPILANLHDDAIVGIMAGSAEEKIKTSSKGIFQ
jgi:hypothetical protein